MRACVDAVGGSAGARGRSRANALAIASGLCGEAVVRLAVARGPELQVLRFPKVAVA